MLPDEVVVNPLINAIYVGYNEMVLSPQSGPMTWLHTVLSYIEPLSHAGLAFVILFVLALESRWPLRDALTASKKGGKDSRAGRQRWFQQVAIYALGAALLYITGDWLNPTAISLGGRLGWAGLAGFDWPVEATVTLGVLVVDALNYASHRAAHVVPWWWRLHKLHHSDTTVDATTTLRHHPLESLLTSFMLVVCYAALGLPLYSILIHGLLVLLHGPFTHANVRMPPRLDHTLRWLIVTPGMHRIHHSVRLDEGNSNFGSVLTWWDRLLGTYTAEPQGGQVGMALGLAAHETRSKPSLLGHLTLPFQVR